MADERIGILIGGQADGRTGCTDVLPALLSARRINDVGEARGLHVLLIVARDAAEAVDLVSATGSLGGMRPALTVLLGEGDSDARAQVLEAGADDCLTGPVVARELGARLGRQAGIHSLAIESARYSRLLSRELAQARRIQQHILPLPPPQVEGLTIAARYVPATQLGGDFFDVLPLDEHLTGLFMADVAGHGVGAALNTMLIKSQLVIWARAGIRVTETLSLLNNYLCPLIDLQFATAVYGLYDRRSRRLEYAMAGHPRPMLIRKGQPTRQLDLPEIPSQMGGMKVGLPLGVFDDCAYLSASITLEPGDRVVLFTDGLIEARAVDGTLLGTAGLCLLLDQHRKKPLADQLAAVLNHLHSGDGSLQVDDDINLLAAEVL
ncbi:MAG: SpoIIE family protein phosphatase [Planctomycetes bacterium]|nr:SpoIIE family protein phosphatase [Planctomycetota bacterium]